MHFGELHSNNSLNDKNNLFEKYIPKCYNVKIILISFNCFSVYMIHVQIYVTIIYNFYHKKKKKYSMNNT